MDRLIWRAGLALVVLSVVATGAFAAYDITGGPSAGWAPEWWEWDGISKLRAEWAYEVGGRDWNDTVGEGWMNDGTGAPPNDWEIQGYPEIHAPWSGVPAWFDWSNHAENADHVDDAGILVPGDDGEFDFDLTLGNELRPDNEKYWYVEFEMLVPTDQNPDVINWFEKTRVVANPKYMPHKDGDWTPIPDGGSTVLGQGWVMLDGTGARTDDQAEAVRLVWWGYYHIIPQPELEKILWEFNTDTGDYPVDSFYINRVTVGTYCTPEPITMALLALGLPLGLLARRRRKED